MVYGDWCLLRGSSVDPYRELGGNSRHSLAAIAQGTTITMSRILDPIPVAAGNENRDSSRAGMADVPPHLLRQTWQEEESLLA